MTTYYLAPSPCQTTFFVPGSNTPGNGALVFTYLTGTTTKTSVAKDTAGAALHTNPIVLDSGGNLPSATSMWLESGVATDVVYAPSNDTDPPGSAYRTMVGLIGIAPQISSTTQWVAAGTPTFINANAFRLAGDVTSTLHVGRRVWSTNTGGEVYSRVSSTTFGTSTTVGTVNDSGTIDSGISQVSYGLLSSINPSTPVLTEFYPRVRSSTTAHTLSDNLQSLTSSHVWTAPDKDIVVADNADISANVEVEDTAPDLEADFIRTYDFSASTSAKVIAGRLSGGVSRAELAHNTSTNLLFDSIPEWVTKMHMTFVNLSTDGTSVIQALLGDGGGIEASGYHAGVTEIVNATPTTSSQIDNGFSIRVTQSAAYFLNGVINFYRATSSHIWVVDGHTIDSSSARTSYFAGSKALSTTMTQVQLTMDNGSDTFDSGSVGLMYE